MKTCKFEVSNYKNFVGAEFFEPDVTLIVDANKEIKMSSLNMTDDIELVGIYTVFGYAIDCRGGFPKATAEAERAKAALASAKARKTMEKVGLEIENLPIPEPAPAPVKAVSLEEALETALEVSRTPKEASEAKDMREYTIVGGVEEVPVTRYVRTIEREVKVEFPDVNHQLLGILEGLVGMKVEIAIKVVGRMPASRYDDDDSGDVEYDDDDSGDVDDDDE